MNNDFDTLFSRRERMCLDKKNFFVRLYNGRGGQRYGAKCGAIKSNSKSKARHRNSLFVTFARIFFQ